MKKLKYIKLFEDFDMEKIMTLSKEKLSEENQKISDKLFELFEVKPLYGVTYAKNLKYIPYQYSGEPNDILATFDLDLKEFDEHSANSIINNTSWENLSNSSFQHMKIQANDLKFDYSINIFIKNNGEVIFRFNTSDNQENSPALVFSKGHTNISPHKQLQNSYTKDFKNSDEMFDFIESEGLSKILSLKTYTENLESYKQKIDEFQEEMEGYSRRRRLVSDY